jgi:hypothetical protein
MATCLKIDLLGSFVEFVVFITCLLIVDFILPRAVWVTVTPVHQPWYEQQ